MAMRCDADGVRTRMGACPMSHATWAWPWVRIQVESLRNIGNIPPYCCLPSATTVPVSFRGDTTRQCPSQDLHFFSRKNELLKI